MSDPLEQEGNRIYEDYPLSEEQIECLKEKGLKLIPTIPDGDCSLNAVLESLDTRLPLNKLRSTIAEKALAYQLVDKGAADEILQPGNWEYSNVMLKVLAELLNVKIEIIRGDGKAEEITPEGGAQNAVTIFHVQGKIGHFYGSQKQ